jgi:hypothetical protein
VFGHAVDVVEDTVCALAWRTGGRCARVGLAGVFFFSFGRRSYLCQAADRRGSRVRRSGRHGFETLDEVVVARVVLCSGRQGYVGSHGGVEGEYIVCESMQRAEVGLRGWWTGR